MKDQLKHWNEAHQQQALHEYSAKQTAFAEEVGMRIPISSSVLELGCGEGNDSIYFAQQGHAVTATDFSDVVIAQNQKRWSHHGLRFVVQDIMKPLQFETASFEVVYARLSLHYFSDENTRKIIEEIYRVLKPGGLLAFMCKSTQDSLYGQGIEIERDMFELDGHVRHFFSEEYAHSLLDAKFADPNVISGVEKLYERNSAYVKAFATKH